ncbi:ESCRT-III subunit protein did4 [Malassezia cuniculi]|uniref:ESCRT-III subunit protein did4 n=1 Tax=Malassezia cuniculi TaxID=948313 RepID=A0AAF0JC30_9BASI|nr:ESCRT-III subunit protein did4 [Malassezia cuniculi]
MSTQLQAVALRMQTLRSTQQMSEAMRGATKALGAMNRSTNILAVQRILTEFERESSTMDMKDEMMNDAMDEALDEDEGMGENEESDAILKEVLDEIGIDVGQQLVNAPSTDPISEAPARIAISEGAPAPKGATSTRAADTDATDDALQARLANLRKM